MLCTCSDATYLGSYQGVFTDKQNKEVHYQRVTLLYLDDKGAASTVELPANVALNFAGFPAMSKVTLSLAVYMVSGKPRTRVESLVLNKP
jgi:hypothetical protein